MEANLKMGRWKLGEVNDSQKYWGGERVGQSGEIWYMDDEKDINKMSGWKYRVWSRSDFTQRGPKGEGERVTKAKWPRSIVKGVLKKNPARWKAADSRVMATLKTYSCPVIRVCVHL